MRVAIRLGAVLVVSAYGTTRWLQMLEPRPGKTWAAVALALAAGLGALAAGRVQGRLRVVAGVALVLGVVGCTLLLAGVPLRLLAPKRWDTLLGGIGNGLGNLPDAEIPFRGAVSGWTARVMVAGGILVPALAALAACRPGARTGASWLAAILVGVLLGVPAVVLPSSGVGPGILLFAGLVALVAVDHVRRPNLPAAAVALAAALGLAVVLFPSLDGPRPWFDYEAAAERLVPRPLSFDWNQTYGTLHWSRAGRELLRIRSRRPHYWKAADLDVFDGLRWHAPDGIGAGDGVTEVDLTDRVTTRPQDVHRMSVVVRGLRSGLVVGAGDLLSVDRAPRAIVPGDSTGMFFARPNLRQGDTYRARFYAPSPAPAELRDAGTDYPDYLFRDREVPLPAAAADADGPAGKAARAAVGQSDVPVVVPTAWGAAGAPTLMGARGRSAAALEAGSAYAGVWRLAARLRARADTPYAYAEAIETYLSHGFTYTETPPPAGVPLADFLLRDRRGYCQHFSGAMALLLRMGGVPARVASGFSPGTRDPDTGEWVVRDEDAHAWVEAFFPGYGWITFDPTPAASPAHGQVTPNRAPEFGAPAAQRGGVVKKLTDPQSSADGRVTPFGIAGARRHGTSPWLVAGIIAAVLLVLAAGVVAVRRRRRGPPADQALAELERALRISGRGVPAETTLRQLEERFRGSADAAGYVRAVRNLRYGAGGPGPTPAERRGLRRELVRGLGASGAVRGWWALPPEPPRRRPRDPETEAEAVAEAARGNGTPA